MPPETVAALLPEGSTGTTSIPHVHSTFSDWEIPDELRSVDLSLEGRERVSALPWRGQFSPRTVERLINALAPPQSRILDQFVGSGTTLLEAARLNHRSAGLDVNPAAIAYANCPSLASLEPDERKKAVAAAILELRSPTEDSDRIELTHALRLLAHKSTEEKAIKRLTDLVDSLPPEPVETTVHLADARATGLQTGSFQFALTSPPYINVFNYHQYGRPLTDSFGWPVLGAARSEVGSNRQNRQNRFKTVVQYSIDMALAIVETNRLLEPGSTAVYVVGRESRVRGVPFSNGRIVGEIAESLDTFADQQRAERRFTSRFGEVIYEDVLVLRGSVPSMLAFEQITGLGREVGRSALERAIEGGNHEDEIRDALSVADDIRPSPIAKGT